METVADVVASSQVLSATMEDSQQLLGLLQHKGAATLERSSQAQLELALASLDFAQHSLGCLFLLDALLHKLRPLATAPLSASAAQQLINTVPPFINLCSVPQIRLDPIRFVRVCRGLKDAVQQAGEAARGVLPLSVALRKLQPSQEHITALHCDFLLLCLLAKRHSFALSHALLPHPLFRLHDPSTAPGPALSLTDFLLFCYYGGMVCIGMKKFRLAYDLFFSAITAPASALSAITVAVFKKFVLVSLILHSQLAALPRYLSPSQRNLKLHAQEYVEIANLFSKSEPTALRDYIARHDAVFRRDANSGLVKQVVACLYKRSIQRLTQTYLTLSLADIAQSVKLPDAAAAETHILRMIEDGDIHAIINQRDGMVSFAEDPEQYNSTGMAHTLHRNIAQTMVLAKHVEEMDSSIACDRVYAHKMLMRDKHGRFGGDTEEYELGPSRMFESI